jgi:peptidoglycan hydrolase-like protein with peptidoglycan-binding domain
MKTLSLTFCLAIAALFGSVKEGLASNVKAEPNSHVCGRATYLHPNTNIIHWTDSYIREEYVREAKRRGLSCGVGKTKWIAPKPSILKKSFINLAKDQRKLVQVNLATLGFYKSSIDGLYGKGTAGALTAYNKQYLGGADLKKSANAEKLIDAVLALNKTEVAAPETPIGGDTTVAEVEPEVEVTVAEPQVEIPQTYQAGIEAYNSGDFKTALEQAKLLAPLGDVDAQFYLGKMYTEGKGTLQRNTHAHMWFNLASANGQSEAALERDALTEKMTPAAVEKAQDLAAICMDSDYQNCSLGKKSKPRNQNTSISNAQARYTDSEKPAIKASFREQSLLRRKQIQFALRKLGYYSSSLDGLWGKGTERAVVNYGQDNKLSPSNPPEIFASALSMVDVPSSFSAPQQKKVLKNTKREPSQNSHGLTSIIANPLIPADQAWAICRPKARLVAQDVGSQERSHIQGGRGRNCRVTDNVLGAKVTCRQGSNFPGLIPLMLGIDQGSQAKKLIVRAYNAALDSCLAQYGWSD